jgi:tetratricopeptide (TPR) repeat protein
MARKRSGRSAVRPAARPHSLSASWDSRARAACIVLAGILAYANSLTGPFLFDDQNSIVDNPQIRQLWPLTEPLSPPRDTPVAGRPLVNLSFALNYAWGGLDVRGYHVANIAIHLIAALILFGVVRRTLSLPGLVEWFGRSSTNLAWLCALIWALHPLQTEAVNYLSQRTESMMGLFYLLTLYCAIRALDARRPHRWRAASVIACAMGMTCKESMVTAPLMVVLYDRIFVFDSLKASAQARWGLYSGLAATWLALAALMLGGPRSSVGFSTSTDPWTYFLNQMPIIVRYLGLTVWPRSLVLDYGLPRSISLGEVIVPAAALVGLGLASLLLLVYRPRLGFLAAWFFITLAPTSSFVPIATEVGAERRMYLPLAAIVVSVVVGVYCLRRRLGWSAPEPSAAGRRWPVMPALAALACVCALIGGTMLRNREYSSRLIMASTIVDRFPHGRGRFMLGAELVAAGRHDEAMTQLTESARDYPGARFALGTELFAIGSYDQAVEQLQMFVQALPDHVNVIPAREMLGRAMVEQNKLDQAAEQFSLILKRNAAHARSHVALGEIRLKQGRSQDAAEHLEEALMFGPTDPRMLQSLGLAYATSNRIKQATTMFRRAAAADPRDPVLHNLLGRALASQGQFAEAIQEFQRALELDPGNEEARQNLAAAQQDAGSEP